MRSGKHYSPPKGIRPECAGWNRGLTKTSDLRVLAQSQKVSQSLKGGTHQDAQYALGEEFYHNLYWAEGLSLQAIADRLGCTIATVYYYFKKYQIPRRKGFEAVKRKPTAPELKLKNMIERHNLPYQYVGNGAVWFEGYNPDFINVNGAKGIIELFGDYWHTTKIKHWRETEGGKHYHFAKFGFKTLILWENELENEKVVVRKIKRFTNSLKTGVL